MYISYIDKNTNQIVTRNSSRATKKNIRELEKRIQCFNYLYNRALEILSKGDTSKRYRTKYIVKKNKSKRRIDIPDEELMKYQKEMVYIFNNKLEFVFPKCVYGYVKGRNAKQMAEVHKNNYQVIKVDIKDFFPSCTFEIIMKAMTSVYPFCLIEENIIETILKPCMIFYDGKFRLPQGAPTSPILSNIAMIPIDFKFECFRRLKNREYSYVYTRFADDIIISCNRAVFEQLSSTPEERLLYSIFRKEEKVSIDERKFSKTVKKVINTIEITLKPNFTLNTDKTKVLNTDCGNVWMLGVTIGEDSVKIGNKKKQILKATLWSFLNDCKNNKLWNKNKVKHLLGVLGYAKYIEPDFVKSLITKYEEKTKVSMKKEVKKILCM